MQEIVLDSCIQKFKQAVENTGLSTVVIGFSGGVDSAVAGAIATRALGADRVIALHFLKVPYAKGRLYRPTNMSFEEFDIRVQNWESSKLIAKTLGLQMESVSMFGSLKTLDEWSTLPRSTVRTKVAAYLMSGLLFSYAFQHKGLVCGTLNRTELLLGHFTRNTFDRYDVSPIEFLYKHEIRRLAYELGLPESVAERASSCGCQADEESFEELPGNLTYQVTEPALIWLFDDPSRDKDQRLKDAGVTEDQVDQVAAIHRQKRYKLNPLYMIRHGYEERSKLC